MELTKKSIACLASFTSDICIIPFYSLTKDIIFEVYAPLGSPGRVRKQDSDPDPLEDPVIKEIASKHGARVSQVRGTC